MGAGRGGGPEHVCACSEVGLKLTPFAGGRNLHLHPGEEKSIHDSHRSLQQRPGSLCLVPISPLGVLGPPVPTNPPGLVPLPLGLSVPDRCHFAAPAALSGREQRGDSAPGSAGRQAGKV